MIPHPEADDRRRAMLRTAMGPVIAAALADPAVLEVMVNPDGSLRLDRLGEGCIDTGARLGAAEAERIIRLVASHVRAEVHADSPVVSAELPSGERFEGLLPPVAPAPCFAIRKPASRVHTLADYIADGILTPIQADGLRAAVRARRNILIAGGTSSGKTTLANALLAEVAAGDERVILIEDTRELQCAAPDCVSLRTRRSHVSLADLVRSTLRLRPDRILDLLTGVLPEVRALDDAETLTFLHGTISTKRHPVAVPEVPMYLDGVLVDTPLTGGLEPMLGAAHLRTVTGLGFPGMTRPGLLDALNRLDFGYRWVTRFLPLDKTQATRALTRLRRQWFAKRKSITVMLREVLTNEPVPLLDSDADNKVVDADAALQGERSF